MKKILLIFLSVFAFASVRADITWNLSNDGTLTISGTDMPIFYEADNIPWKSQRANIKKVVIKDGVTNIGRFAFEKCSNLTSVTIPNSVTRIEDYAFHDCSGLTSITIPNSVTGFGLGAFYGCTGLTSITIPNSVTTIWDGAFEGCTGLASITIPNSVTNIRYGAFYGCTGLTSITIPNSVTSIGDYAFYDCRSLTSITIPNSVTTIGNYVFCYCYGLESITIPNSVTSIGNYAFCVCYSLKSITIPNSVVSIGEEAFFNCSGLESVTIPNSMTSIGNYAFYNCKGLKSIAISNSVKSIGYHAFKNCSGLTSITVETGNVKYDSRNNSNAIIETSTNTLIVGCKNTVIPNSVTSIGNSAFEGCTGLTSIKIPKSVTSVENYAFYDCSGLTSVTNLSATPQSISSNSFIKYGTLHVLPGCKERYQSANYWKNFTIVEDAVDESNNIIYYTSEDGKIITPNRTNVFGSNIISNTYKNGRGIITFDGDVTSIGNEAFMWCSSLKSIMIPNSVTSIGAGAFAGCSSLTSVTIPNSVTSIGNYAFEWCSDLISITIPNSVTNIGHVAFFDCSSLTSITIPNSVTSIGEDAFYNCSGLTSITISNSVTSIENSTFSKCTGLTTIAIPNSVTSIGNYAFEGCSGLTSIVIPNSVISIGEKAFFNCSGLESVTIPNSMTSIGDYAFMLCSNLTSITIEKGNTRYDSRDNCNAIIETSTNSLINGCKNTIIPNTVENIRDHAFIGCSGLTSITIPNSVTRIEEYAFYGCSGLTSVTNLSTTPQSISSKTFTEYGTLHVLPGCKEAYQNADYWKNFTIVEDAVDPSATIELADGKTYNNEKTQNNKNINYTRIFGNTSWQSLYIPFSMTYDDWKDDFEVAYINGIRQMDTDDDGAIDETIMDVVKIKSGSLIPNTPYLIKAKTTGNKTITVNDATLYKAESNSVDCSTTIAKYTFTGTYSTIPAATLLANNYYAMGGGSLIMTDGTSDLKPFRWYLNVESRSSMYNVSSGAKAITINVVGEEEATGISQMSSDREHSSAIYDLNGRRMSQKNLKSGLYIKNGKKIIIK